MPKFENIVDKARRLSYSVPKEKEETVFRVRCFYCKKAGHRIQECRKKKKDEQNKQDKRDTVPDRDQKKSIKCYKCHRRGHIAKDCHDVSKSPDKVPCVQQGMSVESPSVSVTLGKREIAALLDSGASVSCISLHLLEQCFSNKYYSSRGDYSHAAGTSWRALDVSRYFKYYNRH